ncbi:tape measure protein [Sutcliffiella horikoshii]|uniref:tape measure protein n=1 Tax=Sutcliffiella horikoshii TaxID=79883 RepID=UPI003CF27D70
MSGLGVNFEITALDSFTDTFKDLEQQTKGISDKIGGIGKTMVGLGGGLTAASGVAMGVGLNYLAGMEKAEIGLNTLTGSAEETERIMSDLQDFAVKTPFEFDGMLQGTRRLIGMGMASGDATDMLKATADAVAAAGGGASELDGVLLALGQIQAKGKISAEEMNQLAERGIPAWGLLSDQMGLSTEELMKLSSEGKLLASDALPALQKGFTDAFGGAAEDQSNSFLGRLANIKEQLNILAGALAEPIFEPLGNAMGVAVEKLSGLSTWFQKLPEPLRMVISLGAILAPLFILLAGGLLLLIPLIASISTNFAAFKVAMAAVGPALTGTLGPIALIVLAIAGLIAAVIWAWNNIDSFRAFVIDAWKWIQEAFEVALIYIGEIVKTVMNEVTAFFSEQLAKITAFWAENGDRIMGHVKTAMDFAGKVIKTTMSVIEALFTTIWPIISGAVQIAWGLIKTIVGIGVDTVLGLIDAAMYLLEGDWEGAWDSIKGIAEDIWDNIEGFFENIDLKQIGKDIIQGLINGIGAMATKAAEKALEVASAVKNTITGFFGVKSPARLMIDIGGDIGAGLNIGIGNATKSLIKTAKSVSTATLGGFNFGEPAMAGAYDMASARSGAQQQSGGMTSAQASELIRLMKQTAERPVQVGMDIDGYEIARATFSHTDKMLADDMTYTLRSKGIRW